MLTRFVALSSAVALLTATQVDAHGHLVDPMANFGENKAMMSSFAGRIPEPNTLFPGSNFPATGTKGNYNEFMKHFKNGTQSLKEIILANNKPLPGATKDCGFTVLGEGRTVPTELLWGKNEGKAGSEGFRPTHLGACETYCDDTLVQKNDECATAYNQPDNKGQAKVPIESAKCAGAKQLTFYWLSTQAKDEGGFQVYANCVALSGSGGSSSATGTATTKPSPSADAAGDNDTPATTPKASSDDDELECDSADGSDDGSDDGNDEATEAPKTKKPKKSKKAKTHKPKKEKKPVTQEEDSSSGSDAY